MLRTAPLLLIALSNGRIATTGYGLHTEPAHVHAGQQFDVVARGNDCERLFAGDPYGDGAYDEVSYQPGLVRVQVGYEGDLIYPCDHPASEVRVQVGPLAAGHYQIELHGRVLFTDLEDLLQAMDVEVRVADTPPARVPTLGWHAGAALAVALAWSMSRRRG